MGLFDFFKKPRLPEPEVSIEGIDLYLKNIPGAIEHVDGFPRVRWAPVREATKPFAAHPGISLLWTELASDWLGVIRDHLGDPYDVYEGEHLLLLSFEGKDSAQHLLEIGDAAYNRLERLLNRSAEERGLGKHAVLLLNTHETYYTYLSYFQPERDQTYAKSAGVHLGSGYRHTAINAKAKSTKRTLVHELAHDMVSARPLPNWLNEGLAQFVEDMVPGYRAPLIDSADVRLHHRYWSWFGMDHFWDGRAFSGVGSQRLSYQMADVLFRNLAGHPIHRKALPRFLATADRKDAGRAACAECFGCTPGALVEAFLGPGPWESDKAERNRAQ